MAGPRISTRRLSTTVEAQLRAGLAREHARQPFRPAAVRDAAGRTLTVAEGLGLHAYLVRGGLDVGGAELDHVWAVVESRVVDVTLPVLALDFVTILRAFVAGDVLEEEIDDAAAPYSLEWRVVGDVPSGCRYLGRPILSHRTRALC